MAKAPFTRFPGFRYRIRPPYSPIRFGVKMARVKPASKDSVDFHSDTFSIFAIRYFHLKTSVPQLRTIKPTVNDSNQLVRREKAWLKKAFILSSVRGSV